MLNRPSEEHLWWRVVCLFSPAVQPAPEEGESEGFAMTGCAIIGVAPEKSAEPRNWSPLQSEPWCRCWVKAQPSLHSAARTQAEPNLRLERACRWSLRASSHWSVVQPSSSVSADQRPSQPVCPARPVGYRAQQTSASLSDPFSRKP